ncbi:MAG: PorV/PorQ family protein [Bacteroidia bacterium]
MKTRLFCLLILLFCFLSAHAQVFPPLGGQRAGISALTFLKMDLNPRAAALGGAGLCITGDAYSPWTNPAAFSETKGLSIGAANTFWASGVNAAAFSIGKPTQAGHFALSFTGISSGAMEVRTEFQPGGTGELFYASYFTAGLSYGKQLTDYFSYGVNLKYVREQLDQFAANTAALDMGFLYRTDFKDLSFAVQVKNFGLNSVLKGDLPGENPFVSQSRNLEDYPAPTVFQLGVSMIPWKSPDGDQAVTTLFSSTIPTTMPKT